MMARSRRMMATPAEPLKPVSHFSRAERSATYSPWCSSARGTMKPSRPLVAIHCRSSATRGLPTAGSPAESKVWNMAGPPVFGATVAHDPENRNRFSTARIGPRRAALRFLFLCMSLSQNRCALWATCIGSALEVDCYPAFAVQGPDMPKLLADIGRNHRVALAVEDTRQHDRAAEPDVPRHLRRQPHQRPRQ